MAGGASPSCIFCQIARSSTFTPLLHSDEKVVAFPDKNPSAFRHYLVIPTEHIPTVKDLQRRTEDFSLVSHMLNVGQTLLQRDAPQSQYRFGFHQPPLNSVDHLHLHCLALPFIPRWKHVKYMSLGPLGGFIGVEKLLERIKPVSSIPSEAINLKPVGGFHILYKARSSARLVTGNMVEALEDAKEALTIAPKYPEAYICQGDALIAIEQFDAAERSYAMALELDPSIRRSKSFKARMAKLQEKLIAANLP